MVGVDCRSLSLISQRYCQAINCSDTFHHLYWSQICAKPRESGCCRAVVAHGQFLLYTPHLVPTLHTACYWRAVHSSLYSLISVYTELNPTSLAALSYTSSVMGSSRPECPVVGNSSSRCGDLARGGRAAALQSGLLGGASHSSIAGTMVQGTTSPS